MESTKTQLITRTAMILALTLVFQNLRLIIGTGFHTQFIIGSLVNAALIVSVGTVNVYAGLIISIIAPVVAFIQGQLPLPVIIPIVAIGNALYVFLFGVIKNKNTYISILVAAVAKYIFLFIGIVIMISLLGDTIPSQMANVLSLNFSWPQLVTAIIGGFLGLFVIKALNKAWKK